MNITASIHNAQVCTLTNTPYWISKLRRNGKHLMVGPPRDTFEEAQAWCRAELRARGLPNWDTIEIPNDTTPDLTWKPRS